MVDIVLVSNKKNTIIDVIENLYDSPVGGSGTVIKSFTASNDSTSSIDYLAYIFDATGALVNAVIPQTTVVRDRASLGASIISHVIPAGGSLRTQSSTLNLNYYVTGKEQ